MTLEWLSNDFWANEGHGELRVVDDSVHISTILNQIFQCKLKAKKNHEKSLTRSSDPSGQSGSPSQRHLLVMQKLSEHLKSVSGGQVVGGHPFSSLWSPQSSSPSQRQRFCIHRPLPQVNSSERQVSSMMADTNRKKWEREKERKKILIKFSLTKYICLIEWKLNVFFGGVVCSCSRCVWEMRCGFWINFGVSENVCVCSGECLMKMVLWCDNGLKWIILWNLMNIQRDVCSIQIDTSSAIRC